MPSLIPNTYGIEISGGFSLASRSVSVSLFLCKGNKKNKQKNLGINFFRKLHQGDVLSCITLPL